MRSTGEEKAAPGVVGPNVMWQVDHVLIRRAARLEKCRETALFSECAKCADRESCRPACPKGADE